LIATSQVLDAYTCLSAEYPNLPLRYADTLPVVNIGPKKRDVWVPAELCDIVAGTAYKVKLSGDETSQMIRYACKDPATNANTIVQQGFPQLGLAAPSQGPLSAFGIQVSGEMTTITARVLPPPTLSYKAGGRPNVKVCPYKLTMSIILTLRRTVAGTSWT
jgi:eukaryotic translation initiation factor 2C